MNWLIDLGNTRLKLAAAEAPASPALIALSSLQTKQDWVQALSSIRADDRVFVCAVATKAHQESLQSVLSEIKAKIFFAKVTEQAAGIKTQYDTARLGIDRFLQLIAARSKNTNAQLVISVGSAMTVDLLDADGIHRGGWIAPREQHLRDALAIHFPALNLPQGQDQDFALNTADAVSSGAIAMQRGAVQYAQQRAERILDNRVDLIFCGGGAQSLAEFFAPASYHPFLALQGLAQWAEWSELR